MNWKEYWKQSGKTQKALAEEIGVPKRTLEDWITGRRTPPKYIEEKLQKKTEKPKPSKKEIRIQDESPLYHLELPDEEPWTINDELIDIMIDIGILRNSTDIEKIHRVLEKIEEKLDKITE